jgi:hypothetical protein
MSYLETLDGELAAVGIRGRRRARIVAEFADHLDCDPQARLGEPSDLARQFADELGTTLARRAAFVAFAALAVVAALFAAGVLRARGQIFASATTPVPVLADAAVWLTVLGAQVALVSGLLAALRAFRLREAEAVARAQAATIVRRASVGVAAGVVTMVGFGLSALALHGHVAASWTTLVVSLAGGGILVLLATAPTLLSAGRVRPAAAGPAGDLNEDLGPLMPPALRTRPWSLAILVAVALAAVITVAGAVQSDAIDGALRGLADGAACLVGFAVLGRYLNLRA